MKIGLFRFLFMLVYNPGNSISHDQYSKDDGHTTQQNADQMSLASNNAYTDRQEAYLRY